jgi:hypothetical protein
MIEPDFPEDISVEDRFRRSRLDQFVGDAAALGPHWIYDLAERQQLYPGGVGAWLGARLGTRNIPKAWIRLNQGERISAAIDEILPLRPDSKARKEFVARASARFFQATARIARRNILYWCEIP